MTRQGERIAPEVAGVVIANSAEDLAAIKNDDCAGAVWLRPPLTQLHSWLDEQAPEDLPRVRVVARADGVRRAIQDVVISSGLDDGDERKMLVEDIVALADMFSDIMKEPYLRLRLDVIETNACRKFHMDAVTARLVCTYCGTGTQYGTAEGDQDPTHIVTVPTGAPILLRGSNWPVTTNGALRHRSPPIEGTGETRLVFVIDPIFDLDGEMAQPLLH